MALQSGDVAVVNGRSGGRQGAISDEPHLAANGPMTALRVLIVEDEAIVAMLFADLLVAMGHEVCAIEATEAGAVAAAVRCRPDLMIVDAHLMDGSGASAVAAILRAGFVPHVFVSGDPLTDQPLALGSVALQKPFREADLVRAIGSALAAKADA
jgi:two-component system, response regulator PdtaR